MSRATWFCVDIECSGPVPHLYDMISLGVVVLVPGESGKWVPGASHYVELRPESDRVDAGAMAVNGLDIERLRTAGTPLADGLRALSLWVAAHTAPGSSPVFIGHNAPFDWSFVSYTYHLCGLRNPFGYKALDTKALAMGVLGVHWFDTNKELLEVELGLPAQDAGLTHRADYDAWYQALILAALLERNPACAAS